MEKGYYKDPKTGELKKGDFEDAWKSFVDDFEDDESQLDDNASLEENLNKIKETIKKVLKNK